MAQNQESPPTKVIFSYELFRYFVFRENDEGHYGLNTVTSGSQYHIKRELLGLLGK